MVSMLDPKRPLGGYWEILFVLAVAVLVVFVYVLTSAKPVVYGP